LQLAFVEALIAFLFRLLRLLQVLLAWHPRLRHDRRLAALQALLLLG
jgi:hypothetical protein